MTLVRHKPRHSGASRPSPTDQVRSAKSTSRKSGARNTKSKGVDIARLSRELDEKVAELKRAMQQHPPNNSMTRMRNRQQAADDARALAKLATWNQHKAEILHMAKDFAEYAPDESRIRFLIEEPGRDGKIELPFSDISDEAAGVVSDLMREQDPRLLDLLSKGLSGKRAVVGFEASTARENFDSVTGGQRPTTWWAKIAEPRS